MCPMFHFVNAVECACEKCGHRWITEVAGDGLLPRRCSKCKSRLWNGKPVIVVEGPAVVYESARVRAANDLEAIASVAVNHAPNCKCFICKPPKEK